MVDTTPRWITLVAQHLLAMLPHNSFCDVCYNIGVCVYHVYVKNYCLDLEDFQMCAAKMSTLKQLRIITLVAIWICSVLVA